MDGGDAERKVEKPEDSRMVTGGTRESKERARQTGTGLYRDHDEEKYQWATENHTPQRSDLSPENKRG
jgi:hypothetical protein